MLKNIIDMMKWKVSVTLLAYSLLVSCSGIKTYQNTTVKNLHIKTETDSGSVFSNVQAAVDVYRVNTHCEIEYEGTVQLNNFSVDVGIPSDRLSYLVFVFHSSGFLASSSGTTSYNTLLKPRPGYSYDIKVSYRDDIYNVVIQELDPSTKASREIEFKNLGDCGSF